MPREYEVRVDERTGRSIIGYTENGISYSFLDDPANSDYQRYLRHLNGQEENGTISQDTNLKNRGQYDR